MGCGVVGNLVTHAGREGEDAAVGQLGSQLALQAEHDVPFAAPVIGKVTG